MAHQSKSHGSKHQGSKHHGSKHHGSTSSHNSSSPNSSRGGEMLGTYIYNSNSPSEVPYQGQPKTKEQRRYEMKTRLDNFDHQFSTHTSQASYQQGYSYSGTER